MISCLQLTMEGLILDGPRLVLLRRAIDDLPEVDIATKDNLERLVIIGQRLLAGPLSRINLDSGLTEPVQNGGTNEAAIKRFARLLSTEMRCRQLKSIESQSRVTGLRMSHVRKKLKIKSMVNTYYDESFKHCYPIYSNTFANSLSVFSI
ncbi:hypothetical protein CASFOL_006748 [Castilleja foliolosa]|uniref:Uncharacterized protein n=1 Tax=Castilleja foliolosa TaxID=1961234 RepID=A0ABD3E7A1_9LAMI